MTTPDDNEHDKLLCERLATTVDHGICKCAERHRIAELEAALQAGRDLMAVVHCDGGHYREAHGDRKAADDAIAIVSKLCSYMDDERARRASSAPEDTARRFHDAYEHFAPQFGYSTRPESRVAWDELPQNLRDLMIAVVRNVLIEQPAADAD